MSKLEFTLQGVMGELKVYEDRIEIIKKGRGVASDNALKTLSMSNIIGVSVTPGALWARGYIEFIVKGGKASYNVDQAMKSENALLLKAAIQNEAAMNIKSYVEEKIIKNASDNPDSQTSPPSYSLADELIKFKGLLDAGVITREEFDAKKKQLLGL